MSTTNYPFTGNELNAITFAPTLDGKIYSVSVKWNMSAQRWYFTVTSNNGTRLLTAPLIGSGDSSQINLLFGVFTTQMVWREDLGNIQVTS